DVGLQMLVAEVVLMERETTLVAVGVLGDLGALRDLSLPRRQDPLHALARGAPLVEPRADADVAIALALGEAIGRDLAQRAPLEVGQLEILEHDLDQLVERDVSFVVIDARTIAGLAVALPLAVLAGLADDLPRLRVAGALSNAR